MSDPYVLTSWSNAIVTSFQKAWASVAAFVPQFVSAVVVFILGWIIASVLGRLVNDVVRALQVDTLLKRLDVDRVLERGGIRLNSGAFVGALVKWFIVIVFLLAAANILGLSQVSDFLRQVLLYIPNVVVAAVILVIAIKVAEVVERAARSSVESMGMRGAVVGVMVRWAIWIFALVAALLQLGIATLLIQTLITGLVAMLALAFGLAFGLGGKDVAASFLDKLRREMSGRA